jgi:zinc protease
MSIAISQKDPNYTAVYMMNELLGGGSFLNSRIPQRLREAEGMSYGAGSFFQAEWDEPIASFGTYAFFNPIFKDKLNTALMEELTKASQGTFTETELADIKKSQIQERKLALGNNNSLASMINKYMEQKKDLKYFDEFSDQIQQISIKDVNEAAKKYLKLDQFLLIYSGDFRKK